jgi:hypothetical protein
MDYQVAKNIRKKSFADMMTQMIVEGGSVSGSFGKTLSQKMKARATGLKEKFDPLNIVKWMTGGSNLAPAILGRLLGRSKKDMEYFTGKSKPVRGKNTRIDTLEKTDGMTEVLDKIYGFMKKTLEYDTKRREKDADFRESQQLDDERRHKELIKALEGIGAPVATATPVKEDKGDGIFGILKGFLTTVFGKVFRSMKKAFEWIMDLKKYVPKIIEFFEKWVPRILEFFESPLFLEVLGPALAIGAAGYLFEKWWKKHQEEMSQGNVEEARTGGGATAAAAAAEMERLRKEGDEISDPDIRERMETQQVIRDDAINRMNAFREDFYKHSGFRKSKNWFGSGFTYKDSSGKEPSKEMNAAAEDFAEDQYKKIWTGEVQDPIGKFKEGNKYVKMLSERGNKGRGSVNPPMVNPDQPAPAVQQTPNVGQKLNSVTDENNSLNIEDQIQKEIEETVNNTNVTSMNSAPPSKVRLPAIRNTEDTFSRISFYNTRPV